MKKFFPLSSFLIVIAISCKANSPVVIPLWENLEPPVSNELPKESEVVENEGWISFVTTPELIVYPAENPNGKALLMCPGGGYAGVAISHEGKELAPILNEEGTTLAVLKYRMPNGHSTVPSDDVKRGWDILIENAEKWGINTDKIGIGGASAGGHLASTVATKHEELGINPAFQILFYPVISMKEGLTHGGSRQFLLGENPDEELVKKYSSELNVTETTPQAFIVVSGNDTVVPVENSIEYFMALKEKGVPVSLHIYPEGGHGWGTNQDFKYARDWRIELVDWMKGI